MDAKFKLLKSINDIECLWVDIKKELDEFWNKMQSLI